MLHLLIPFSFPLVQPEDRARAIELVKKAVKMTTVKDYDRYVVRWFNLLDIKGCSEYYFFNGNPPLERTTKLVLLYTLGGEASWGAEGE